MRPPPELNGEPSKNERMCTPLSSVNIGQIVLTKQKIGTSFRGAQMLISIT